MNDSGRELDRRLQVLLKRARWVFEETVVDSKMTEANRMLGDPVLTHYRYLKSRATGSRDVLKRALKVVTISKYPALPPPDLTTIEKLQWIGKTYPGVLHELVTDEKEKEALEVSLNDSAMLAYLLKQFDTKKDLLEFLTWLLHTQQQRRKSWRIGLALSKRATV